MNMQSANNLVVHDTADRVLDEISSSSISIGSDDNMNVPNPLKVEERFEENNNVPNPLKTEKNNHVISMSKTKKSGSGRWTFVEHNQFLHGLKLYGREWKLVANCIPTRTSAQIRSHAQKYFAKMSKDQQETVESTEPQSKLSSRAKQKTVDSTEQQTKSSKEDTTDIETKVVSTLASLRDRYQHLEDSLQQVKTPNPLVQTSSPATAALQQEQTTLRQAAQVRYEMKRFTGQKKQSGKQTEKNSHCAFVSLTSFPSQNGGFNSSDVLALSQMGTSLKRGPPLTNTSISIIKDEESFKHSLMLVRDHLELTEHHEHERPKKMRRVDNNL